MRRFSQVDVFAEEFLLGNPVAVVHDADDLTSEQMAGFARWTNLSETTFLLQPSQPGAHYRLRIFTPERELPFAGHPTLGSAAAWLAAAGADVGEGVVVQECAAGFVPVRRQGQRLAFAAPPLVRGGPVRQEFVAEVSAALRLDPGQVVDAQWADNGPGWVALLLDSADSVLRINAQDVSTRLPTGVGVVGPYPPASSADFEVRAFVGDVPLGEDPVTGSLNAALGQWLIPAGLAPASYVVSQGTRLQRAGRVYVEQEGGNVWVGGNTVLGISGTVSL